MYKYDYVLIVFWYFNQVAKTIKVDDSFKVIMASLLILFDLIWFSILIVLFYLFCIVLQYVQNIGYLLNDSIHFCSVSF